MKEKIMNKKNSKRFMVICLGTVLGFGAANVLYEWHASRKQPEAHIDYRSETYPYTVLTEDGLVEVTEASQNECFDLWLDADETPCHIYGNWTSMVNDHCKSEVLEGRKIAAEMAAKGRNGNANCRFGVESAAETLKERAETEAKQERLISPYIEQ